MLGTDFPYTDWYPKGKEVIQIDARGRATSAGGPPSDHAIVGDARLTVAALLERVAGQDRPRPPRGRDRALSRRGVERQMQLADPDYDSRGVVEKVRATFDNPDERIRPEAVAVAVDRHAASDAIFTTDTGMSTVWLSRFVTMRGDRRLLGSYNLGSMANAMPQALGAQALDRDRQVIAFCGDGGLTMLLGDLITAVTHQLPVRLVVFNNGRLGMVKLEQEQAGLPEFGTELANVDLAGDRRAPRGCTRSASSEPDDARRCGQLGVRPPRPGAARRGHQPRGDLAAAQGQAGSGVGVRDRQAHRDAGEPRLLAALRDRAGGPDNAPPRLQTFAVLSSHHARGRHAAPL